MAAKDNPYEMAKVVLTLLASDIQTQTTKQIVESLPQKQG